MNHGVVVAVVLEVEVVLEIVLVIVVVVTVGKVVTGRTVVGTTDGKVVSAAIVV